MCIFRNKSLKLKLLSIILLLIPFVTFANEKGDRSLLPTQNDSLHSSAILSADYKGDTLYLRVKHYSVCCEKFVTYDDYTEKKNRIDVNIVYMNLENDCLCHAERIIHHKIFYKDLREVQFKLNGLEPEYGMKSYVAPKWQKALEKKKRKKKKKK